MAKNKKDFAFDDITAKAEAQQEKLQKSKKNILENLVIDEEFRLLIPPLLKEEYEQLEQNILAEKIREPLIVWKKDQQYILIDGHNRYEIAQKHGLDIPFLEKEFEDRQEAITFMLNNQLGRRNLSLEQRSYLRGKRYESQKMSHGGHRQASGQNVHLDNIVNIENELLASGQNVHLKTSKKIGEKEGVSEKTIRRDYDFAKALDKIGEVNPALKKDILAGKTPINKTQLQQLAKIEHLPLLEKIEDLEHLFKTPKTEKPIDQLQAKKDFLAKFIKNSHFDLTSLQQIEKLCLDLAQSK